MVRLSVVLLLAALVGACSGAPKEPTSTDPGAALYATYCAACHLASGAAVPNLRPALAGSPLVNGEPQAVAAWIMYGTRPAGWVDQHYPPVMPHYSRLSDTELATLLSYLRSHFGNAAGPVSSETIATLRSTSRPQAR